MIPNCERDLVIKAFRGGITADDVATHLFGVPDRHADDPGRFGRRDHLRIPLENPNLGRCLRLQNSLLAVRHVGRILLHKN